MTLTRAARTATRISAALALALVAVGCGPEQLSGARGATATGPGAPGAEPRDGAAVGSPDAARGAAVKDGRRRLALLIAVQDYERRPDGRYGPLLGTRSDAGLFGDVLAQRFGFAPDDVLLLQDRDATVDGIVRAFREHLIARAQTDDEVVVYLAGHGSRVPDESGMEREERDSTWVGWDSRREGRDGEADLTDDALHTLVRHLIDRTGCRVTVVTDSCHSGGVLRGGPELDTPSRVRSIPDGSIAATPTACASWPTDLALIDDDERARRGEFGRAHGYVHLAACAPHEEARETWIDGTVHGLFTWSLVRVLQQARPTDSWQTVHERTAALLRKHPAGRGQTPQIDGEADRLVFGAGFAAPWPGHPIVVRGGDWVGVEAGNAQGVTEGVVLEVFGLDGSDVGRVEVLRSGLGRAVGRWQEVPNRPLAGLAMRGRIVDRPAALPRLVVAATGDEFLDDWLRAHPWARLETDPEAAEYRLTPSDDDGSRLVLRSTLGIEIWRGERPGGASDTDRLRALGDALRLETQWRGLWDLADSGRRGDLKDLEVRFELPEAEFLAELERDADAQEARGETAVRYAGVVPEPVAGAPGGTELTVAVPSAASQAADGIGMLTELVIENRTLESVHLHVIALTETRGVHLLWPTATDEQLPGDGRAPLRIGVQLRSEREGFPLDRPMRERYLVLATMRPLPLDFFRERVRDARGEADELPGPLATTFDPARERRTGTITDSPLGWGLAWVDVLISERR